MRDDDVVRRARAWATGATVHDVNAKCNWYQSLAHLLDHPERIDAGVREARLVAIGRQLELVRKSLEDIMAGRTDTKGNPIKRGETDAPDR